VYEKLKVLRTRTMECDYDLSITDDLCGAIDKAVDNYYQAAAKDIKEISGAWKDVMSIIEQIKAGSENSSAVVSAEKQELLTSLSRVTKALDHLEEVQKKGESGSAAGAGKGEFYRDVDKAYSEFEAALEAVNKGFLKVAGADISSASAEVQEAYKTLSSPAADKLPVNQRLDLTWKLVQAYIPKELQEDLNSKVRALSISSRRASSTLDSLHRTFGREMDLDQQQVDGVCALGDLQCQVKQRTDRIKREASRILEQLSGQVPQAQLNELVELLKDKNRNPQDVKRAVEAIQKDLPKDNPLVARLGHLMGEYQREVADYRDEVDHITEGHLTEQQKRERAGYRQDTDQAYQACCGALREVETAFLAVYQSVKCLCGYVEAVDVMETSLYTQWVPSLALGLFGQTPYTLSEPYFYGALKELREYWEGGAIWRGEQQGSLALGSILSSRNEDPDRRQATLPEKAFEPVFHDGRHMTAKEKQKNEQLAQEWRRMHPEQLNRQPATSIDNKLSPVDVLEAQTARNLRKGKEDDFLV
jgi:hypothetical protein